MKKSVVISIAVSIVLTLTLALTTIVTAFGKAPEAIAKYYFAYRDGDVCEELKDFENLNFAFDVNDEASMIYYNEAESNYVAKNEGTVCVSATKGKSKCEVTIEVFTTGLGNDESPLAIANAKNLVDLSERVNGGQTTLVCELKADINMAGINFVPIGNRNEKFVGKLIGNEKTISNLSINVNAENYANYLVEQSDKNYIDVGLFGYTDVGAEIRDVNLKGASISVAQGLVNVVNDNVKPLRRVSIGAMVANATQTTISGEGNYVEANINGYSYGEGNVGTAVSGLVGVGYGVNINGYKVNARIVANGEDGNGSKIAGVIGLAHNENGDNTGTVSSTVNGVDVTLTANVINAEHPITTYVGAIGGYMWDTVVTDSVVSGVAVNDNLTYQTAIGYSDPRLLFVGGAVGGLEKKSSEVGIDAKLNNVKVLNAEINVKSAVAGLVNVNFGTITNCSFNGNLTGVEVGGLVHENKLGAGIIFDENFTGNAVSGLITGYRIGGVAYNNAGNITANADNKAKVSVILRNAAVVPSDIATAKEMIKEVYSAGVAVSSIGGTIENLDVDAKIYDGVNMAGLVGIMGKTYDVVSGTSILQNCDANVTMISNNLSQSNVSTTYSVGGAVGFMYAGNKVLNNAVNVNVNTNRLANRNYGVAQMGGLVARVYQDGVTISGNTVSGTLYANYAYWTAQMGGDKDYEIMLVGGLIGSVSGYGTENYDSFEEIVFTNSTVIANNNISDLVIDIEYINNNLNVGNAWAKVRAIGSVVGSIIGSENVDFSDNTVNITIDVIKKAFAGSGSESTNTHISDVNRCFGCRSATGLTIKNPSTHSVSVIEG